MFKQIHLGDWLKDCRNEVDVTQAYEDCKVDYCMDQTRDLTIFTLKEVYAK